MIVLSAIRWFEEKGNWKSSPSFMTKFGLLLFSAVVLAVAPAVAREKLGVFGEWSAIRDPAAPRCYAIAQPLEGKTRGGGAYASIGHWPQAELFNQPHFVLSQPAKGASLLIGRTRYPLAVRGRDAWARNRLADAAVVTAMRRTRAPTIVIDAITEAGKPFSDRYALKGIGPAIDAAAEACQVSAPKT